jgi:MFS family permease
VSAVGDAASLTAMPLLVLLLTGSAALMGTVAALQFLPDLVLGLPAGALADRWDRRRLMIWSDAGRALLTMAVPVTYVLGGPTMAVILLVAVPVNALRVISDSAFNSSVPGLVGRANLGRAYSAMETVLSVPFIIGPAIAGVLVVAIGASSVIGIDALTFAFSAASLLLVRRSLRAERPAQMPSVLADIRQGVAFVLRHSLIRTVILFWAVLQLAVTPLIPLLAFYLTVDRGANAELFGLVGSAWSVGYLGGSILVGRLSGRRAGLRMVGCAALAGVAIAVIALSTEPVVYLAAAAAIGASLAVGLVSYGTLRTSATPDDMLGRVGSMARTLVLGVQPVALLGFGALADATSGAAAMLAMAAIALLGSLVFVLLRPLREAAY